jgi:hypothetical protein
MKLYPAVIVHGPGDALAALAHAEAQGLPVTLLSAPGAALYAGCGWWRSLTAFARAAHPNVTCIDILDCADGTGVALAALRIGVTRLVLWPNAPGRNAVLEIAESLGGFVMEAAPAINPRVNLARVNKAREDTGTASHRDGGLAATAQAAGKPRGKSQGKPRGSGDKRRTPG